MELSGLAAVADVALTDVAEDIGVPLEVRRASEGFGGFTKLGVPSWGPYYKGILLFRGSALGSPMFVNLHLGLPICYRVVDGF